MRGGGGMGVVAGGGVDVVDGGSSMWLGIGGTGGLVGRKVV